ncbi:MAG: 2Fe-2S iron-sulfur cluster binding domain-containing protein [Mucilaginibacter polytrichastri]|nr:2Fe-2S iron-sulfur cluster binding domain-containing protein [Mucilaginibacter polytrichastri]
MPDTFQVRITAINRLTAHAAEFVFSPENFSISPYLPGQFLTLIFSLDGHEVRRSFSLNSVYREDQEHLSITVKRVENGLVSRHMLDHLQTGDLLRVLPPSGRFTLPENVHRKRLVYFAAGSGIVPVYAHLRYLATLEDPPQTDLFYSNTSERSTLYSAELFSLAKTEGRPWLHIHSLFSQPEAAHERPRRINNTFVETELSHILEQAPAPQVLIYLCGPYAYMRMIRMTLLFMGLETEQIRMENFVVETAKPAKQQYHFERQTVQLIFQGEKYSLDVEPAQNILDAALKAGIALPYSCKGGICSACAAKCTRGRVEMTINEVLSPDDLRKGEILTCTGHPLTADVLIEFP